MQESQRVTIATGVDSGTATAEVSGGWRVDLDPSTRYEHRRELGRGGMGEVALAFDRGIDRPVAVKRLCGSSPDEVARFVDEARIVGRMEHPNVVPVHDIGVDPQGRLFFVMKYVEGDTLRQVIDRLAAGDVDYLRRYPFARRVEVFVGLLRALQYAHKLGILHRDIKPENIVVGRYGEVVLMDWGIARLLDDAPTERGMHTEAVGHRVAGETSEGSVLGTPAYMSPEQAAGKLAELDRRSDLYSAFVVFYELLTLRHYVGRGSRSLPQILVEVQDRELPSVEDPVFRPAGQPAVPIELRHFLRRGLQRVVEQRFVDADAVLEAMQCMRSGEVTIDCPITFAKHMGARYSRLLDAHPLAALVLGAVPFVGLLLAVVLLVLRFTA